MWKPMSCQRKKPPCALGYWPKKLRGVKLRDVEKVDDRIKREEL